MKLIDEVDNYFGTKNLYDVLNITKEATRDVIKKAYRKASLKIHPDRVDEEHKESATKKFQVLAQVHYILSDDEKRKLYDDHGIIANDDSLDSEADWTSYWRLLFPKITIDDINSFVNSYIGSEEEEEDLIKLYMKYKGDLDLIYETHICYDEDRTTAQLRQLIKSGKIPNYNKFSKESESKKARRARRFVKEAKESDKVKEEESKMNDLTALIKQKSKNDFNSMIANLEAKYGGGQKGQKRKRQDR